jgi:hypothetical protein
LRLVIPHIRFNRTTNEYGQVVFTLPQGDYHFRADLNGTHFWSGEENHCTVPGCESALVELPGAFITETTTIAYTGVYPELVEGTLPFASLSQTARPTPGTTTATC